MRRSIGLGSMQAILAGRTTDGAGSPARSRVHGGQCIETRRFIRSSRQRPRAKLARFNNSIPAVQFFAEPVDRGSEPFFLQLVHRGVDAKQDNCRNRPAATEHQIAEILVLCQQESIFRVRTRQDLGVAYRRRNFRHVNDIVAGGAEVRNQPGVDTFVRQPAHCQP
jgi:hypothetical protein